MKEQFRVKKNSDFDHIIKLGYHCKNSSYSIHVLKNENVGHLRVGISASTKLGNAVVRNRLKRQVRAIVQELLDVTQEYDIIIIVKKNFIENDYMANKASLVDLLKNKERQLLKK